MIEIQLRYENVKKDGDIRSLKQKLNDAFQNALLLLVRWAEIRDLIRFPETKILSLYHDNPDITDDIKLRTSLCITVPEHTNVEGVIGKMVIPGGKYAVVHYVIGANVFKPAWDFIWDPFHLSGHFVLGGFFVYFLEIKTLNRC